MRRVDAVGKLVVSSAGALVCSAAKMKRQGETFGNFVIFCVLRFLFQIFGIFSCFFLFQIRIRLGQTG